MIAQIAHNMISYDRDAGLAIKAWLDVNDNNHDAVAEVLNAYVGWVQKVGQIILISSSVILNLCSPGPTEGRPKWNRRPCGAKVHDSGRQPLHRRLVSTSD